MADKKEFRVERVSGMPVTDDQLLNDLRRVAAELRQATVGQKQYRKQGLFDDTTVSRRFGSWNAALKKANLEIANEVSVSDDQLFENLLALWALHGRQPRRAELASPPSRFSQSPYGRRFGSWRNALHAFVEFANASQDAQRELAPSELAPPPSGHRTSRDPSWRLRFQVLQRDGFRCRGCGSSPALTPGVELQVDHVLAWSRGGETTIENLQTLCTKCNGGKSDLPP